MKQYSFTKKKIKIHKNNHYCVPVWCCIHTGWSWYVQERNGHGFMNGHSAGAVHTGPAPECRQHQGRDSCFYCLPVLVLHLQSVEDQCTKSKRCKSHSRLFAFIAFFKFSIALISQIRKYLVSQHCFIAFQKHWKEFAGHWTSSEEDSNLDPQGLDFWWPSYLGCSQKSPNA